MTTPRFAGADYVPSRDDPRLVPQLERIKMALADGQWWTLRNLADRTGAPEASASAQLRHLRSKRHGSHIIERRHRGGGLYEYRWVQKEVSE